MEDKRRLKRFSPIEIIYVFNNESFIGYLEDISLTGIKLMSEKPIPIKNNIQVRFEIDSKDLMLEAQSVWEYKEEDSNLYYTGFHFSELESKTIEQIQNLISELSICGD